MKKRVLAMVLALLFCLNCGPIEAIAAGPIEEIAPAEISEELPEEEPAEELAEEPEEEIEEKIVLAAPSGDEPEAGGYGSSQIVISFDANGGEGWTNSLYYNYGDEVFAPECGFTRQYYNFIGWGVDPEGPVLFLPGAPLDISESMSFYAIWEPLTQEEMNELYAPKGVSVWSQGFSVDHETGEICTRTELRWNKVEDVEDFTISLNLGAPDGPRVPGTTGFNISEAEVYWSSCYFTLSAPFLPEDVEQTVTDGAVNGLLDGDTVYATLASSVNGMSCPGNPVSFVADKPVIEEGGDPLMWFVTEGYANVAYDDYGTATVTLIRDTVLPAEGFRLEQGTEVHFQMNTCTMTGTMIDTAGTPLFFKHLTPDGPVMAFYNYAGAEIVFDNYGWFNGSGATSGSAVVTFTDKGRLINDSMYSNLSVTNGGLVTEDPWTLEDVQSWGFVNTQEPDTYEMGRLSEEELAQHIPQNVEVTPLETGLAVSWDTDPVATEAEIYVDVLLDDDTVAHYIGPWTVCAPGYGPEDYCWLESGGFNYTTIATTMLEVDEEQIVTDGYVNGILPNQTLIVTVTHLVGPFWQETPRSVPVRFAYGPGNFGKTFNAVGLVDRPSLSDGGVLEIRSSLENLIYNGQGQTLDYSVFWNGEELEKGVDCVGRYSNYVGPGTATLTVIALRPYAGALSQSYTISEIDLGSELVTVSFPDDLVYTGSSQMPEPVIICNGYTLERSRDYNVSYRDYTNAGEATATITPGYRGTCVGERVEHYTIAPRSMTSSLLKVTLPASRWAWTGSPITPAVTLKWGSQSLSEGTDYSVAYANNTDVGTATVTVTGIGNYADERTVSFEIFERVDLAAAAIIEPIDDLVYNRSAQTPEPIVTVGRKVLRRGLDYGVSYENNKNAGTATVTVNGCGEYRGVASAEFTILPAPLEGCVMTVGRESYPYDKDTHIYDGHEFRPSASVKTADGYELYEGTSFTLSYRNNVNVGEAQVIATGMGNYDGTLIGTFTIDPMAIETVNSNIANPYYNGQAQEAAVKLHHYYYDEERSQRTRYMTEGVDYEILGYANNVNAGEATVTVRGLGNYTGEHAFTFNVTPMPVNVERDFTLSYDKAAVYTGSPVDIHIQVKWKLDGRTLAEGTDYTVEYWGKDSEEGNRTDICDYCSARITFCGNFSGSYSEIYFAIVDPGAVELPVSGVYSGTNWSIDAEGTLTVWGDGATADLSYHSDVAWRPYRNQIKKIVVLQGITYLTAGSFADCRFATEVVLPDGLTGISYSVFTGCDSLQKINIPDSVTTLHQGALPQNKNLAVHLPDNISDFSGYGAMENVKAFVNPGSVTEATLRAKQGYFFYEGYPDFQLWDNNDSNGLYLIHYVGSGGVVTVPDFVDYVYRPFSGSYLIEKIIIPGSVSRLDTFQYCYGLRELVIEPGDKLTSLPYQFITGCSDIKVYIPDNITSIDTFNYYSSATMLIVANCNSYAIEWAKSQMSSGFPIWTDEAKSESQNGPRYRMLHILEQHDGQDPSCEENGWTAYETCTRCDYDNRQLLPALGHDWGEAEYIWADEHSELTAKHVCARDAGHVETETVAVTARVSRYPSCEQPGQTTYKSAAFENPAFRAQTLRLDDIPAPGHDWGEAAYVWAEDLSTVTASHVCKRDGAHTETETVETTNEVTTAPGCETAGVRTWTAVFENPGFETQTKERSIEPIGHDWGEPEYIWAEDHSTVTASRVCGNDPAHVETETVSATSRTTEEPTCTEPGGTTYTSEPFENPAFEVQIVVVVDVPALGHDWGEVEYTWAEDLSTVTARRVCARDAGHVETETVETTNEVTTAPSCETAGVRTWTAVFENPDFETQRREEPVDPLSHDWGEVEYTWAEDLSTATAKRVCGNDPSHVETETVETANEVTTAPTCENEGVRTWTAVFENPAFETQTKEERIEALNHDWVEAEYVWAEDLSSVTATRVCRRDPGHIETETVKPAVEETIAPNCTEDGEGTYTASFENPAFETQVRHEVIPALGHDWGKASYEWNEDETEVTAERVCGRDAAHVEHETASVRTEVTQAPSYTEEGEETLIAEFENPAFETQTRTHVLPVKEMPPVDPRVAGENRYATSEKTADELREVLGVERFDTVIVAYGLGFADALGGSYLAIRTQAPILVVDDYHMDEICGKIHEILRDEGKIYLLGGTGVVKSEIENRLKDDGYEVKRLAGLNRFDTNLEILKEVGVAPGDPILVCDGYGYADSLSASASGLPILLVNKTGLTDTQKAWLSELRQTNGELCFVMIGGEGAVTPALEAACAEYGTTERLGGKNRYETSRMVADAFIPDPQAVVLSYALNFPDGLCGAPLAYSLQAPLILATTNNYREAEKYVQEHGVDVIVTLGGSALISDDAIKEILGG